MPAADRPDPFIAVKIWYRSLKQTSDEQVMALIERARTQRQEPA
jgi:predicted phosphoribosyltransferase